MTRAEFMKAREEKVQEAIDRLTQEYGHGYWRRFWTKEDKANNRRAMRLEKQKKQGMKKERVNG